MKITNIKIGTRGSKLALWQANLVKINIEKYFSSINVQINIIQTKGDRDQASSLMKIGGQGIFTKAIEKELINKNIDFAVHSLKDLPSTLPDSLKLSAVLKRGSANDAFIGSRINDFFKLPPKSTVACGSIRRRAQVLSLRPDINFVDIRGNINTRIQKLINHGYDGILISEAAIKRLNLDEYQYYRFSIDDMLPAISQGVIGIQTRKVDNQFQPILNKINHSNTFNCVIAERAFLRKLDSGCQFPVAAYAKIRKDNLTIRGLVLSMSGKTKIQDTLTGPINKAEQLGKSLAQKLIDQGAMKLINGMNN
jgi:hydroxymethylbilane synthase